MEIDRIEKLHSIGYGLKDAKVTINHDIKFNVAGLKINGSQGEVLNLPQWIGKILSQNKLATLETPDMITELKQALSGSGIDFNYFDRYVRGSYWFYYPEEGDVIYTVPKMQKELFP